MKRSEVFNCIIWKLTIHQKLWYPLRDIINDERFNCLEYEESLCYWGEEGY